MRKWLGTWRAAALCGVLAAPMGIGLSTAPARAASAPIDGTWLTGKADARIRISPCGASRCGTIVGLKHPNDAKTGKPLTDTNNPDAAKRQRRLVGLTILSGLKAAGDAWKGHVYNSDNGKTYNVTLTPQGPDKLRIEGCLLVFCSGENWTRAAR